MSLLTSGLHIGAILLAAKVLLEPKEKRDTRTSFSTDVLTNYVTTYLSRLEKDSDYFPHNIDYKNEIMIAVNVNSYREKLSKQPRSVEEITRAARPIIETVMKEVDIDHLQPGGLCAKGLVDTYSIVNDVVIGFLKDILKIQVENHATLNYFKRTEYQPNYILKSKSRSSRKSVTAKL